jgi:predicted deacylase
MNRLFAITAMLFCLCLCTVTRAETAIGSYTLGPIEATPGTTVSAYLDIPAGIDAGTRIPVSVIHGARSGPTLALIAGTHGYEYPPITALQRLRASLDPAALSGTVILVHVANPPSFLGRTIYTSPVDGKNLNRAYPGSADGSISERIAHTITVTIIQHADYLVDMHGGDGNEMLRSYVYMPVTGNTELDARVRGMALAFGLDHIVIDRGRLTDPANSVFTDMTGLTRGVPSITTETGQMGSNDDVWVDLAEKGVLNLLRHLKMIDGSEVENTGVVWLEDYQVIQAPATGVFHAAVRDGYTVAEGTLLGTLSNLFGEPIEEIRAPFAGVVNYVVGTPPVSKGEPLAMVSKLVQQH